MKKAISFCALVLALTVMVVSNHWHSLEMAKLECAPPLPSGKGE